MKVYKKDDKIIFEFDYWTKRSNPYMEDGEGCGEHQTFMGLVCHDKDGNEEMGFAKVIDMNYKDKGDQWTDIMIKVWDMEREVFLRLCDKLKIGHYEYPLCAKCGQDIYGCYTSDGKGHDICLSCKNK